jgi:hypothetical protein
MSSTRSLILGSVLLVGGILFGAFATGGTADLASLRSEPAHPLRVDLRPATRAEIAAAQLNGGTAKAREGKLRLKAWISRRPIRTAPGASNFVGLTCPRGAAISGGALTGFTNLVMSQSAPMYPGEPPPRFGKYTPRTWWVAVTNANFDGSDETLPWTALVNCLSPINVAR